MSSPSTNATVVPTNAIPSRTASLESESRCSFGRREWMNIPSRPPPNTHANTTTLTVMGPIIVVVHPPKIRRTLRAGPPGFTHSRIAPRDMKPKSLSKQNQLGWGTLRWRSRAQDFKLRHYPSPPRLLSSCHFLKLSAGAVLRSAHEASFPVSVAQHCISRSANRTDSDHRSHSSGQLDRKSTRLN